MITLAKKPKKHRKYTNFCQVMTTNRQLRSTLLLVEQIDLRSRLIQFLKERYLNSELYKFVQLAKNRLLAIDIAVKPAVNQGAKPNSKANNKASDDSTLNALSNRCELLYALYREKVWLRGAASADGLTNLDNEINALLDEYQMTKANYERILQTFQTCADNCSSTLIKVM